MRARYSTQSATKMFVSPGWPPCRLEANTSFRPSGLNIGKASNSGLVVTRSSPLPSTSHEIQVEVPAPRVGIVRREHDPLPVGMKEGREARRGEMGHLPRIASVGVGHPDLEPRGPYQPLGEEALVVGRVGGGLGIHRPPHQPAPVRREVRAAVVAHPVGYPADVAAVHLHGVELDVAVARAGEHDPLPVGRHGGLGIVGVVPRESLEIAPVRPGGVDLQVVERPDVAVRAVGGRRAVARVLEGGAVEDPAPSVVEVAAGGAPETVRHPAHVAPIRVHHVLLIAARPDAVLALEDQALAVRREIRFGVVAAEGELADAAQMTLAGIGVDVDL